MQDTHMERLGMLIISAKGAQDMSLQGFSCEEMQNAGIQQNKEVGQN